MHSPAVQQASWLLQNTTHHTTQPGHHCKWQAVALAGGSNHHERSSIGKLAWQKEGWARFDGTVWGGGRIGQRSGWGGVKFGAAAAALPFPFLASVHLSRSTQSCASKIAGKNPSRPIGTVKLTPRQMFPYLEDFTCKVKLACKSHNILYTLESHRSKCDPVGRQLN